MGKLNKVQLIGNLGDDIKMHHFEGGGTIGRVSLATNETYKKKDTGEKVTTTQWHNLVFRNKAAEVAEKYTKKGDAMYIEGSLNYRKYQKEDGTDVYVTEIMVRDFEFLNNRPADSGVSAPASGSSTTTTRAPQPEDEEDDLPF